jgi:hypothetical protein
MAFMLYCFYMIHATGWRSFPFVFGHFPPTYRAENSFVSALISAALAGCITSTRQYRRDSEWWVDRFCPATLHTTTLLPMKYTLPLIAISFGLAACDVDVAPPAGGGSTTVVTPEKKVEHNTTIVKPDAPAKTETNTVVTPGGSSSTTTTTK